MNTTDRMQVIDLSIIIATYNTIDLTRRCLATIQRQTTGVTYEIIVVDNASVDGSSDMIQEEFPQVVLVRNTDNFGFAAAQNIGLRRARGQYLLIFNSDVLLVENALGVLVGRLRSGPLNIGVVGPQILNPDRTIAPSARRAILSKPIIALGIINRHFPVKQWLPSQRIMRKYCGWLLSIFHDNYASHDTIKQVDYVDGMCVLVKREALEQTGLFDEQFFFDAEILDLSCRLRARGWLIEFFPAAQVVHYAHASRKKLSRIIVETHRSELIYYAKHAPHLLPFVTRMVYLVVSAKRHLLRGMLLFKPRDAKRLAMLGFCDQILRLAKYPDELQIQERIPRLGGKGLL